jgi:nitrite reductase/ring-hydroxylating ferredoxin subunit
MADAANTSRTICALAELGDPGSRAFTTGTGNWPLRGFVVRKGDEVFAYVNRCPHASRPLNWLPDRFLTPDHSLIACDSHGALFEIDTGACVAGPCAGQGLQRIAVRIANGSVLLEEDPDVLAQRHA